MRKGLGEDEVQQALGDLDRAALPARTVAALRLADCLSGERPAVDDALFALLRQHFDEGEILELGAALTVASGWQRFIEAFGIRPDNWSESSAAPLGALIGERPAGSRYSPMSSAHRAGLAAMNRSISSRQRASWTTSTFTPRLRSRASSPMKV